MPFSQNRLMADLLLTGATGRLGTALLPALYSYGYSVRALVRPGGRSTPAIAERFEWNLVNGPPPKEVFEGISRVVHLAALVGDYPLGVLMQNNAIGTKNLLSGCPQTVSKAVLASSVSVYGERPGKQLDENALLKPDTLYGKSKLMAEAYAREYSHHFPIFALRFGMIYGPGFTEGYYPVFERLQKGKMQLVGSGSNRIPLIHSDDAVRAILLALECKLPGFHPYNIVGSEIATQRELVKTAAESLGAIVPKGSVPAPIAKAGIAVRNALAKAGIGKAPSLTSDHIRQMAEDRTYSGARAEADLGFRARVKIKDGVKQMAGLFLAEQARKERLKMAQEGVLTVPASG
jgi:nucleoside-diphosphate-sugar epimerase